MSLPKIFQYDVSNKAFQLCNFFVSLHFKCNVRIALARSSLLNFDKERKIVQKRALRSEGGIGEIEELEKGWVGCGGEGQVEKRVTAGQSN